MSQTALEEYKNMTKTEVDEIMLDVNGCKMNTIELKGDVTSLGMQYTTLEGRMVRWCYNCNRW